jgi:hypothetical protein
MTSGSRQQNQTGTWCGRPSGRVVPSQMMGSAESLDAVWESSARVVSSRTSTIYVKLQRSDPRGAFQAQNSGAALGLPMPSDGHLSLWSTGHVKLVRHSWILTSIVAAAVIVEGCTSSGSFSGDQSSRSSQSRPADSPVQTAEAWFHHINQKDVSAANADFEPANVGMMNWAGGDASQWPTFSHVNCSQVSGSATDVTVHCTFDESAAPAVGNPDSFWNVSMHRQPSGRWLIDNYGQG